MIKTLVLHFGKEFPAALCLGDIGANDYGTLGDVPWLSINDLGVKASVDQYVINGWLLEDIQLDWKRSWSWLSKYACAHSDIVGRSWQVLRCFSREFCEMLARRMECLHGARKVFVRFANRCLYIS